ncbi:MAG: acyl--CoA ligase [Gammaproteobacteria bacterium]|nr:acyl--CoA ligase [Gammaproteobacteria bacterium]
MDEINNMLSLVQFASKHYGDKIYLHSADSVIGIDITFSYLEIFTNKFNAFCEKNSITIGEEIAVILPNSPLYVLLLISIIATGRILVPINPKAGNTELNHILNQTNPKLIIHDSIITEKLTSFMGKKEPIQNERIFLDAIINCTAHNKPPINRPLIGNTHIAEIVFTSGSTGTPKGVIITHENLIANVFGIRERINPAMDDVFLTMTPLYHNSGQFFSTFVPLASGSSCVIIKPELALARFWKYIEQYGINWTLAMPTHINFLLQQKNNLIPHSLKGLLVGGAPLSKASQHDFEKKFRVNILKTYGLTETCSFATCDYPDKNLRQLGSSGKPLKTNEIKIFKNKKIISDPGAIGEIYIKGANITNGYLKNKMETSAKLINGWLATGDLGYIDTNNNIYIIDRIDNMIIVNGENVYPSEVENLLPFLGGIKQAVLLGIPHDIMGNELVLIYEGDHADTKKTNEWINALKKRISPFKIPYRYMHISTFNLKVIPKAENGKILRSKIKKIAFDYTAKTHSVN